MGNPCDRTAELKTANGKLEIARGDFCDAFEQDTDRLFSNRECWYCKYGDFAIFSEHPTQKGVCRYHATNSGILDSCAKRCEHDSAIQKSKKQEESEHEKETF